MNNANHGISSAAARLSTSRLAAPDPLSSQFRPAILSPKALDVLYELGFEEGDDLTDVSLVDIVSVPGGGPKIAEEILRFRESSLTKVLHLDFTPDEHRIILESILSSFKVRAKNVMVGLNPQTVQEFLNISWRTLLSARSCGRETFDHIFELQCDLRRTFAEYPDISCENLITLLAQMNIRHSREA